MIDTAGNLAQPRAKRVITPLALMGLKWDNETSPRRCANTVNPGALTDQVTEGVIG